MLTQRIASGFLVFLSSSSAFISKYRRAYSLSSSISLPSKNSSPVSVAMTSQFIDIGANLLDPRFTDGIYRGTFRHEPDLDLIMERAHKAGVSRIILTAGTVAESREALEKARQWRETYPNIIFSSTVGVHPTRCQQVFEPTDASNVDPDALLDELLEIAKDGMTDGTVVAIGEIGLDYDRLEFCPKDVQQKYLLRQLEAVAKPTRLPLFLHNRSVGSDLYDILKRESESWSGVGVVHSFDDSLELASRFINDLQLYIGLNGCSLRSDKSLAVVKELPLTSIHLETDCPYCDVRKSHPGFQYIKTAYEARAEKKFERGKLVKNRQEPCHIVQVAEIVAGVKQLPVADVADQCYRNTMACFYNNQDTNISS